MKNEKKETRRKKWKKKEMKRNRKCVNEKKKEK